MQKLFRWCLQNKFLLLAIFFIVFIPLYPKWPLFDLKNTWVYIRFEDIFVGFAALLLIWEIKKNYTNLRSPLTAPILIYWGVGLLSLIISIIFIAPHLANFFPNLAVLHYGRRIEYMSLFFVGFLALRYSKNLIFWVISALGLSTFGVIVYGIGQKFAGWPAFSTMNEEFAKGLPLRLPPTARTMSTFGGHYDLAAFLVLTIPILGALALSAKSLVQKVVFLLLTIGSYLILLFTASRVSLGVYLVSISLMLVLMKKWRYILPVVVVSFIMLNLTSGASERFYKTLRFDDVVIDLSTGKAVGTLASLEGGSAKIEKISTPDQENLPKGSGFINIPQNQPVKSVGEIEKPVEIIKSESLATGSGDMATISGSFLIQKALVYDISITTRFQGQWPRAIEAFQRNFLTGSGFSSLGTAVDGNYHRLLGETGILGFISYLGIFFVFLLVYWNCRNSLSGSENAWVVGVVSGLVGLLLNAFLIDVFDASKVAFMVWLFLGVSVAIMMRISRWNMPYATVLYRIFTHRLTILLFFVGIIIYFHRPILQGYFIGDDFTWLRWASESTFKDIIKYFTSASGFFYRPIPKLWYFALFSLFWLQPFGYHVATLFLFIVISLALVLLLRATGIRRSISLFTGIIFISLAIHHEVLFWISGQSALLAGAFLMLALLISIVKVPDFRFKEYFRVCIVGMFLFFSMCSYDGMIVAPIIYAVYHWQLVKKRSLRTIIFILLIPLYWFIRIKSGAVMPIGDYAYNLPKLPINIIANSFTYLLSIVAGVSELDFLIQFRAQLRTLQGGIMYASIAGLVGITGLILLYRQTRKKYHDIWSWLLLSILSLTAYLGLGGAAERYSLFASIFLTASYSALLEKLIQQKKYILFGVIFLLGIAVFYHNRLEYQQVKEHWSTASSVTETSLLKIKKQFFPLKQSTLFLIVNAPIRYGRAWIFPTGLQDALWHMFRDAPYQVVPMGSVEEALTRPQIAGAINEILVFDNKLEISRIKKEQITVTK